MKNVEQVTPKPPILAQETVHSEVCERCKELLDPRVNATPEGHYLCDECISMDDVFSDD